jgi:hypothetical protein
MYIYLIKYPFPAVIVYFCVAGTWNILSIGVYYGFKKTDLYAELLEKSKSRAESLLYN